MRNNNSIDVQAIKKKICSQQFYEKELGISIRPRWGKKWCLAGLCPFHADRFAGSFYVNVDSGAYKCHACGVGGGDIISFLQKQHGYSFVEATKLLNDAGGTNE
jgi:DNA primase